MQGPESVGRHDRGEGRRVRSPGMTGAGEDRASVPLMPYQLAHPREIEVPLKLRRCSDHAID